MVYEAVKRLDRNEVSHGSKVLYLFLEMQGQGHFTVNKYHARCTEVMFISNLNGSYIVLQRVSLPNSWSCYAGFYGK